MFPRVLRCDSDELTKTPRALWVRREQLIEMRDWSRPVSSLSRASATAKKTCTFNPAFDGCRCFAPIRPMSTMASDVGVHESTLTLTRILSLFILIDYKVRGI